jgi:putative RNA 2'-phosphotransferase
MSRQYVHFAADVDMAIDVGARRKGQTVLLTIRAGDAHRAGVIFYRSSEAVWLADALPPQFIIVPEE